MRKFLLLALAGIFFIALASSASAIMIVPARQDIPYQPGKVITLYFGTGDFGQGMDYEILLSGDYTNNGKIISKDTLGFIVEFTMPEDAKPGQKELLVGVKQVPKGEYNSGGIAALAAVYSQVRFFVPYPARYAEVRMDDVDVATGKMAYFTVYLQNYGNETLNGIKGNISIIDPQNTTVAVVQISNRSGISFMESTEMYGQWDTENQSAGFYNLAASVDYDGIETMAWAKMRVGVLSLKINSIRAVGNRGDGVVKVNVDVSSMWNELLKNVYTTGTIAQNGTSLASMKSASSDFPPWSSNTFVLYWDVTGLNAGVYDITVNLFYADKVKTTTNQIYLMEEEVQEAKASSSTMLYGAVLLLVLAVMFLAVVVIKIKAGKEDET